MARMTALRPGASPPPVEMAILTTRNPGIGTRNVNLSPVAPLLDQAQDFARLGMPANRFLREHERPVHRDLEYPAGGFPELDRRVRVVLLELGGQTGRPGLIASNDAVFDADAHGSARLIRFVVAESPTRERAGPTVLT